MRILLLGECSNAHWTLSQGLKKLGHEVCMVAPQNWMSYNTDINLSRKSTGLWDTLSYIIRLAILLPKWKNYDVVQINNFLYFLALRAEKNQKIYNFLRKRNKKIFMASYSSDYYWLKACVEDRIFRYSNFNIGEKKLINSRTEYEINEWLTSPNKEINIEIVANCNGIPACLYEYYAAYYREFPDKTSYLPLPIDLSSISPKNNRKDDKINFFIGIQKDRSEEKGTDIMLKALERVYCKYPDKCRIVRAESVPYPEYQQLMNDSDVLLDQLYSYTPGMNALLAMAKGLVVVGGGEEECYEILGESKLRPIINVFPSEEDVYRKLEELILNKNRLCELSSQGIEYVKRHHDHIKVAQQYLDFWTSM